MPAKFGTRDSSAGGKLWKAAKEKRTWHLYFVNLHKETVLDDVCSFLRENKVEATSCENVSGK